MSNLRICLFSHTSNLYGAERSLLQLVTDLINDYGASCCVILPKDGPLKARLEQTGATTLVIPYLWWCERGQWHRENVLTYIVPSLEALLGQVKTIERENFDVFLSNTITIPWGALTAAFLGKPHAWYVREFGELDHGLHFWLSFCKTIDFIQNCSSQIFVNSNAVGQALFPNLKQPEVCTVYNHITIPPLNIGKQNKSGFMDDAEMRLIISGTVAEGKGQLDAILAVKELIQRRRKVKLTIMGEGGDYLRQLKKIVHERKLASAVTFTGFVEDPYSVMKDADIVLVCSRNEAFGRTIAEAMLLQKVVVAANSGGIPELITDDWNGRLYTPANSAELADRIEGLILCQDSMRRLARNGFEFATATFTKENYAGRVYERLSQMKNLRNDPRLDCADFFSRLFSEVMEECGGFNLERTSLGWKVLERFRLAKQKLLPKDTYRRRVYDQCYRYAVEISTRSSRS